MLAYIPNAVVNIERNYICNIDAYCVLQRCIHEKNPDAFNYLYRYIVINNIDYITQYPLLSVYLSEAIKLCTPTKSLVKTILLNCLKFPSNKYIHTVLSELVKYELDDTCIQELRRSRYSHLLPDIAPLEFDEMLNVACMSNDVKEVKHRIRYHKPNNIRAESILKYPTDNREAIELILPYVETSGQSETYWLMQAYVNNKLPGYIPEVCKNSLAVKAVTSHFTGSIGIENSVVHMDIYFLASKFGFSGKLLYQCIRYMVSNDVTCIGMPRSISHEYGIARDYMNGETVIYCDQCEMCKYLNN